MRRREFLALVGAASGASAILGAAAAAQPTAPECGPEACSTVRVRLFGPALARLEVSCVSGLTITDGSQAYSGDAAAFDSAAPDAATIDGRTQQLAGPLLFVKAAAPIAVAAFSAAGLIAQRSYAGWLNLAFGAGGISAVNVVDIESYVAATLASEVSPSWNFESLKAQAIVSRTYVASARSRSSKRDFDVTDGTSSQVYHGADNVSAAFVSAAAATAGHAIFDGPKIAQVFYSAACGGHTAAVVELTGRDGPAYLDGIVDADVAGHAYCARATYFQWKNLIPSDAMARLVGIAPAQLSDVAVAERWPDGRVKTIAVSPVGGDAIPMDGHAFYRMAAASLGYKVLPSTLFDVRRNGNAFEVNGRGLGHGVGMCQWGARGRADAGASGPDIVRAYFPGTNVRSLPA